MVLYNTGLCNRGQHYPFSLVESLGRSMPTLPHVSTFLSCDISASDLATTILHRFLFSLFVTVKLDGQDLCRELDQS